MKLLRQTIRRLILESTQESKKSIEAFISLPQSSLKDTYGTKWNPEVGYLIQYGTECPVYLKLEPWGVNQIYINELTIADPDNPNLYDEDCENKGYATLAMKALIKHADKHGSTLLLEPLAFNETPSNGERPDTISLEAWYARLGFEWTSQDNGLMEYVP